MIHLILLAAGSARRFGANKLMWPVNGKPMFIHTLQKLLDLLEKHGWDVTLIAQEGPVAQAAQSLPVNVVINPDHALGISSSIRRGIAALPDDTHSAAFFVADQPWLAEATAEAFLEAFMTSGKSCGCVAYGGETGNPAAFSRALFPELMALEGDRGGKRVLMRHLDDCMLYEVANARELADIDTPQDC